jgi:gliding motility-associated-like protein
VVNDVLIYVPNTITVNHDGINEKFLPVLGEAFLKETYHLSIFNRWGKLVFESYNYEVGWDGYYADHFTSQDGTYTWMITVKIRENEDYLKYVGHVNVLNGVDKR